MNDQENDLILDVGNSRTKLALFRAGRVIDHGVVANGDLAAVLGFVSGRPVNAIAMGSVAAPEQSHLSGLRELAPVLVLDGSSPAPLTTRYRTPLTLGADRLANVVAGADRFPGRAVLVIDAGSCITYDLIEADGTYAGGAISPGVRMRARAMHDYSARLPLVDPTEAPEIIGTDTKSSLEAGIHHGILGEMRGFIGSYGTDRPEMAVLLTGGDALRSARGLENGIFALPFLTLEGYHALLVHHRTLHGGLVVPDAAGAARPGTTG